MLAVTTVRRARDSRPARPTSRGVSSDGDIRVLLVLDLLLSFAFAAVVVWGLDFVSLATFTLRSVATLALALAALTYLVVLR